jgi:hypothetical protein
MNSALSSRSQEKAVRTTIKGLSTFAGLLVLTALHSTPSYAQFAPKVLKIMRQGLGDGTVDIVMGSITVTCTDTCEQTFILPQPVTLEAKAPTGTAFVGWEGGCSGTMTTCSFLITSGRSVRAVFRLDPDVPPLPSALTPENINQYLIDNPSVTTTAQFMRALPEEFRKGWILMTRSESLQTGTARFPRVMLPSADSRYVFTLGLAEHASYPGAHPNAIEFMQWDGNEKNFRFHEIVMAPIGPMGRAGQFPARLRGVSIDEQRCTRCHSTRNIRNPNPAQAGTTGFPAGLVKAKNKPNWDSYDSWGGMLPFNRDKIFPGSVEAAALRRLLNPWTWRNDEPSRRIMEQLELQSNAPGSSPVYPADDVFTRINGGPNDGLIQFAFDGGLTVVNEPNPTGPSVGPVNYKFDGVAGAPPGSNVVRPTDTPVILHAVGTPLFDEGRGVQLFDQLAGGDGGYNFNQIRIGNELANHRFATGSVPFDARPLALAINDSCIVTDSLGTISTAPGAGTLLDRTAFFSARHGGMNLGAIIDDTGARARDLPRRKADIQKLNLDRNGDNYLLNSSMTPDIDLISEYGPFTGFGTSTAVERLRQEVFRRGGGNDQSIMGGGFYVDREDYGNTNKVALFRYFLEPLGVAVDKWSIGVRGRSRNYTFADVLGSYPGPIRSELQASLNADPYPGVAGTSCSSLITAVNSEFAKLPAANARPTYTDIQRIFNKGCIECHGGLDYPPYARYSTNPNYFDLSERENPASNDRLRGSFDTLANGSFLGTSSADSTLFARITSPSDSCPFGAMPCGGPRLAAADVATVKRWLDGPATKSEGDPHLVTVDNIPYDFQSAGEFTLLRGPGMELQSRHTPIATDGPLGPDGYTGLSSCPSLNTAAAMQVGRHRVTLQPGLGNRPNPEGLELRIDGKRVPYPGPRGIALDDGGRIMATTASGGIQVQMPSGTEVIVTPGFWSYYQLWYLNINVRNVRATFGLMGSIAPQNWLPALPDGSTLGPQPGNLAKRYDQLYATFADAWRVNKSTSLFDYGSGVGPDSFVLKGWPAFQPKSCLLPKDWTSNPTPPKQLARDEARKACSALVDVARQSNCEADAVLTGDIGVAATYLATERIELNARPERVELGRPEAFDTKAEPSVTFNWKRTSDKNDGKLTYMHCLWPQGTTFTMKTCTDLPDGAESTTVYDLKPGQFYYWKVLVDDGQGATVASETRKFQVAGETSEGK